MTTLAPAPKPKHLNVHVLASGLAGICTTSQVRGLISMTENVPRPCLSWSVGRHLQDGGRASGQGREGIANRRSPLPRLKLVVETKVAGTKMSQQPNTLASFARLKQ